MRLRHPADEIQRLRELRRQIDALRAEHAAQFDRCFAAGGRTMDIADAAGMSAQAVSIRRRQWRERRMTETVAE